MAVSFKVLFSPPKSEYLGLFAGKRVLLVPLPSPQRYLPGDLVPLHTTMSQLGYSVTFTFEEVENGTYCCGFEIDDKIFWKSAELEISTGNERFEFQWFRPPEGVPVFLGQLQAALPSINERLDQNLSERLIIEREDLRLRILNNRIKLTGEGAFTRPSESILGSEISFTYFFWMGPTGSFWPGRMIELTDWEPIELAFENVLLSWFHTLFPAFLQDKIRNMMEKQLNTSMLSMGRAALGDRLAPGADLSLASFIVFGAKDDRRINEEGKEERAVVFDMAISIPTSALSGAGCFSSVLLVAVIPLIAWITWWVTKTGG